MSVFRILSLFEYSFLGRWIFTFKEDENWNYCLKNSFQKIFFLGMNHKIFTMTSKIINEMACLLNSSKMFYYFPSTCMKVWSINNEYVCEHCSEQWHKIDSMSSNAFKIIPLEKVVNHVIASKRDENNFIQWANVNHTKKRGSSCLHEKRKFIHDGLAFLVRESF